MFRNACIVAATVLAMGAASAETCDYPTVTVDPTIVVTCYEPGCAVEWDGAHYRVHCSGRVDLDLEGRAPR